MPLDVPQMNFSDFATWPETVATVRRVLREDVGEGDLTTLALVGAGARSRAAVISRKPCVVAGIGIAVETFRQVDSGLTCRPVLRDGDAAGDDGTILFVEGPARAILTAERTALNFLQRLCGIATLTRRFVDAVAPYGVAILDTRKTTPGLRLFEKYAVRCGGGRNHRMGLYDMVLIKDNHRRFWGDGTGLRLDQSVAEARRQCPGVPVEIEVETAEELDNVLPARPDWVLLDNMTPELVAWCADRCRGVCRTEASGGISLDTVGAFACTGVDAISIGALTHSAPAADLSLEIEEHESSAG